MNIRSLALLCLSVCLSPVSALAQDYLYATGSPAFSKTLPVDMGQVTLSNGNLHLEIPIFTRSQRGSLVLQEKLVYDSRIWSPTLTASGNQWQPQAISNSWGGWRFESGLSTSTALVFSTSTFSDPHPSQCGTFPGQGAFVAQFYNWRWTDPNGTVHYFPNVNTSEEENLPPQCTGNPPSEFSNGAASDGSGYTLTVTSVENQQTAQITSSDGIVYGSFTPGAQTPIGLTDPNGNQWTADSNGNLVDTSGQAPVVEHQNGSQIIFDVAAVGGTTQHYTVNLTSVSFSSGFSSGGTNTSGTFTAIQSIVLPDGSSYMFGYDSGSTPGHYGELTSMTLPTRGVISYSFQNFTDDYGAVNQWLRTLTKDGGTTTITPASLGTCSSSSGCQQQTKVTSPDNNDTVYTFNMDASGQLASSAWTQKVDVYQGPQSGGNVLRSASTGYTYSSVFGPGGNYSIPTSETDTITLPDANISTQTQSLFPNGIASLPSEIKVWDYGTPFSGVPDTDTNYGYVYGFPTPSSITMTDGSGNQISKITYGFDESALAATSGLPNHTSVPAVRGNPTSKHEWINTSNTTLDTAMTYDDAGQLINRTSPSGKTVFGYDATDTVVTSHTYPSTHPGLGSQTMTLSDGIGYDASTFIQTSTTDPNGATTTYSNFDQLNRPVRVSYPNGSSGSFSYINPNEVSVTSPQSGSQGDQTGTLYDAYGRVMRDALMQNASTSTWILTDTCYDQNGRVSFRSYPYTMSAFDQTALVCSGAGDKYAYDALNRVKSITHGDGSQISYRYIGRATQVTDENAVSRITQTDAFGRTTAVCELSNNPLQGDTPSSCGTDIAGTGYVTSYAYNFSSHLTTVTQGVYQTRSFQTDSLGRNIATNEPERGQTNYSYSYNSNGLQVVRTRPAANQGNAGVTTNTTTQYDGLGRAVTLQYSDGTPEKIFFYDAAVTSQPNPQSNIKGRLSGVFDLQSIGTMQEIFSYDSVGLKTLAVTGFPYNSKEFKVISDSYDFAGNILTQQDPTAGTISYTYDQAGEVTSINGSLQLNGNPGGSQLASNIQYGANGVVNYTLGNGLGEFRTYDGLGRATGRWLCGGGTPSYHCNNASTQVYGTELGWSGSRVINPCDTVMGCRSTGYDEFNRLQSVSGTQNFTYTYDRYGNRWGQSAPQGGPAPNFSFDKTTNRVIGYSYDAAGNLVNDGIHSYTYDAEGNVTQVDGGSTAAYWYDALNQRFRVQNSSGIVDYQYDPQGRRVTEWAESADFGIRGNIYWGNAPFAFHGINGTTYFQQQDYLGTERVRTDDQGNTTGTYVSDAFGDGFSASGTDEDPYHFAMTDRNAESATDNATYRQYAENSGRWMSPDPYDGSYDLSNPQSLNRYSYVLNDPLSMTDSLGLDPPCAPDTASSVCVSGNPPSDPVTGNGWGIYIPSWGGPWLYDPIWVPIPKFQVPTSIAPSNATIEPLTFNQKARGCASDSLGISTAAAGGAVVGGLPLVGTAGKFVGNTPGTSIISSTLAKLLPGAAGIGAKWAPTLMNPMATSAVAGRVLGRWAPVIGEVVLAKQAADFGNCLLKGTWWDTDD